METSKKIITLAMAMAMIGVAQAEPLCSPQDKISLAKSGYSKKEIDAICANTNLGSSNTKNSTAPAKPSVTTVQKAPKPINTPLAINGKTGMDAHDAYQRNDFATARKIAEPLAEAGDPIAMRTLGRMRYFGKGLRKDELEAVSWFRKAADKGDGWAMYNLASDLQDGTGGLKKDLVAAESMTQKAITAGFSQGYRMLASVRSNAGSERGYTEALTEGIKAGSSWCMEQRGSDLIWGSNGAEKDINAGIAMLERAAQAGNKSAALTLANKYYFGSNGFPQDRSLSYKWYTKAAELYDVDAMLQLSALLEEGEVVPKNQAEADKWQRKAAEAGHSRAAWFEAEALRKKGRDQEAERFYLISAYGGNVNATYALGYLYGSSDSLSNYFKSVYWYLISKEIEPNADDKVQRANILARRSGDEFKNIPDSIDTEIGQLSKQLDAVKDKPWEDSAQQTARDAQKKVIGMLLEADAPINALITAMQSSDLPRNKQAYRSGYLQVARVLKAMRDKTGDKSYLPYAISALMMANLSTTPNPEMSAMATDFGDAEEALRIAAAASEKRLNNATFAIVARSFHVLSDEGGRWENSKALMDKYGLTIDSTPSYDKTTLLHMAIWNTDIEAINFQSVQKLVELGADINAKDSEGDTPLDYALHKDLFYISEWMKKKGAKSKDEL